MTDAQIFEFDKRQKANVKSRRAQSKKVTYYFQAGGNVKEEPIPKQFTHSLNSLKSRHVAAKYTLSASTKKIQP